MTVNRFLVMRHGESLANVSGEVVSDPARGVLGFGLSPRGREQARRAPQLFPELWEVTRIHASDFCRARETATLVQVEIGLESPVVLEPDLRERFFGSFEGGGSSRYPEIWRRDREHPAEPGDGIEPAARVLARARGLRGRLDARYRGEVVLLVCHGDVAQILLADAAGLPAHEHRDVPHLDTAGVRRLARPPAG